MDDAITTNVVITKHSIGKTAVVDHTAQSTNLAQLVRASTTIPAGASARITKMTAMNYRNSIPGLAPVDVLL